MVKTHHLFFLHRIILCHKHTCRCIRKKHFYQSSESKVIYLPNNHYYTNLCLLACCSCFTYMYIDLNWTVKNLTHAGHKLIVCSRSYILSSQSLDTSMWVILLILHRVSWVPGGSFGFKIWQAIMQAGFATMDYAKLSELQELTRV